MSPETRVVFDTNVLVSALLFEHSIPGQAMFQALDEGKVLISQELVLELQSVLNRSKFDRYLDTEDRELFLELLILQGEFVVVSTTIASCRDPKDNHLLSLAVDGDADYLVTGDHDLLILTEVGHAEIITPTELLHRLTRQ
jgi:putative PIN family toxin of toxin-antitoxin system